MLLNMQDGRRPCDKHDPCLFHIIKHIIIFIIIIYIISKDTSTSLLSLRFSKVHYYDKNLNVHIWHFGRI